MVIQALAASGLAATRLGLEITESVLLQDSEATLATLRTRRASLRSDHIRELDDETSAGSRDPVLALL